MKEEAQKNPTVSSPVLFVKGVQKQYKNLLVLKQINLTLYKEEIVVLVGKNGSGKSTLFRILLGLDTPDKGIVATKQKIMPDDAAYREIVNGQHHVSSLYDNLTAIQNLDMLVGVFPNADAMQLDELIHVLGLETEMHKNDKHRSLVNGEKELLKVGVAGSGRCDAKARADQPASTGRDVRPQLLQGERGETLFAPKFVERAAQIGGGVRQRAVEVEQDGFRQDVGLGANRGCRCRIRPRLRVRTGYSAGR